MRARDTLARLGGNEFALILEHCGIDQVARLAQKICDRMDAFRLIHETGASASGPASACAAGQALAECRLVETVAEVSARAGAHDDTVPGPLLFYIMHIVAIARAWERRVTHSQSARTPATTPTTMHHDPDADASYHMRLLVDRVPTMLAYWDRRLICRFANRAYEAWFGVDPDRLIGTHIRDLLGPRLFELNHPYMLKALAGERQLFERVVPGPGGVERQSLAEYIPDTVDGEVRGFLVQVTNLTELKQTQAALQRETELRGRLEDQAAELRQLLAERTEMLHVLAHEVRQPLNNASAALQSARRSLDGRARAQASDQVEQAQAVLGEVLRGIDNTLTVASLLARPEPIQRDDIDVETLIAIAIADMPAAERSRVRVVRDTPTRTALMDMSLIRLALRNLLSNALKFSPPDTPVVVRVADTEHEPALHLAVADQGPGIPAALLPQLFSRGARGGTGSGPHGMGLGLYIVERVMALHGGRVQVRHTGKDGTTLELVIPQSDPTD